MRIRTSSFSCAAVFVVASFLSNAAARADEPIFASGFEFSTEIPFPVTTHPRLWITAGDVPRLRSWAVASNPVYADGIAPLVAEAEDAYEQQFFPNGAPNPVYPDPGDVQGYTGLNTEQYALVLAFDALIDPVESNRRRNASRARDLLMYAMNLAALGHADDAPFRDRNFAVYNRANGTGEQWPLIVDWLYDATDASGARVLSAVDRATIRKVFLEWSNDCIHASTTYGDHPEPIGAVDSLDLLPDRLPYRMAANNYYLGHARLLTMMALAIDPDDDPPLDPSQPVTALGNTLRSYIRDATGAWLYQEYAMFGEANAVTTAYGIAGADGFGLASGGLPPEGMLYGHSIGFALGQLLALRTAGFDTPGLAGPQAALVDAPVWNRFAMGYLSSLTPAPIVSDEEPWLGPVYEFASYGDLLRLWVTPDMMQSYALWALIGSEAGDTARLDTARWFAINAVEGGADKLDARITDPWSYSSTSSILYFLLLDPAAAPPTDPRATSATLFRDRPAGRIVAHENAAADGAMFDYRASWISINHQVGDGGQFELYRHGEWLTKEMSNYDNHAQGLTTKFHNTLALKNWSVAGTPGDLEFFEPQEWANGSQWMLGSAAGDPLTLTSAGEGYVYADSDLAPLYDRPRDDARNSAMDIQVATRSILWIEPDVIVVYDRARTTHDGLFKRFNLSLATQPAIAGSVATETLASGQQLFIQTLLPTQARGRTEDGASQLDPIAELEPMRYLYTVEDGSNPTDIRFLHVLQGADPGAAMSVATRLVAESGDAFDGTAFDRWAVYFPHEDHASLQTTTLPVPAGAGAMFVAGLAPRATYSVTIQADAQGRHATITPAASGMATDEAGLLRIAL